MRTGQSDQEGFSGSAAALTAAARNRVLAGLLRASGRACAAGVLGSMCSDVHACVPPFIGHLLDADLRPVYNLLKSFIYINSTATMTPHGPGRKSPDPPVAGEARR